MAAHRIASRLEDGTEGLDGCVALLSRYELLVHTSGGSELTFLDGDPDSSKLLEASLEMWSQAYVCLSKLQSR